MSIIIEKNSPTIYNKKYIFSAGNYCGISSATGNCQMNTLNWVQILVSAANINKNELDEVMKDITQNYSKKLLLLDINQVYIEQIKTLFKKYGFKKYKKMNYISTNNSKMCILILKKEKIDE